jgi:UDP-glucuronate 4-epimerase
MKRDFTYIDDIIEGVTRVIKRVPRPNPEWSGISPDPGSSYAPYKVYNIGANEPVELMDFVEIIEEAIGMKAEKEFLEMQAGDVPLTYADVKDLEKEIDFKPKTSIRKGIHKFIHWYRSYYDV